jgi:hypothetical protein
MSKARHWMRIAVWVALPVILLLNVGWEVAAAYLEIPRAAWSRWFEKPYIEADARAHVMLVWSKDVPALWQANPDPPEAVREVRGALSSRGQTSRMRYAVASIEGEIYVSELPPAVLNHHWVMDWATGRIVEGDELSVAAIWAEAFRHGAVVDASPDGDTYVHVASERGIEGP